MKIDENDLHDMDVWKDVIEIGNNIDSFAVAHKMHDNETKMVINNKILDNNKRILASMVWANG